MLICNDCGTQYAQLPVMGCNHCGSGNIAIVTDGAVQIGKNIDNVSKADEDYVNKMLRHLLEDLCEQVCNAPAASTDFRDNQIERTIARIRPYLRE